MTQWLKKICLYTIVQMKEWNKKRESSKEPSRKSVLTGLLAWRKRLGILIFTRQFRVLQEVLGWVKKFNLPQFEALKKHVGFQSLAQQRSQRTWRKAFRKSRRFLLIVFSHLQLNKSMLHLSLRKVRQEYSSKNQITRHQWYLSSINNPPNQVSLNHTRIKLLKKWLQRKV